MFIGSSYHFGYQTSSTINQVQKLVLHRYLLNFSLGLCGLILFSDFKMYISPLKRKKYTRALFLASDSIFYNFFQILDALWASQFEF